MDHNWEKVCKCKCSQPEVQGMNIHILFTHTCAFMLTAATVSVPPARLSTHCSPTVCLKSDSRNLFRPAATFLLLFFGSFFIVFAGFHKIHPGDFG